jgi:hypothetical protein
VQYYNQLKAQGMSPEEAERQTDAKFGVN